MNRSSPLRKIFGLVDAGIAAALAGWTLSGYWLRRSSAPPKKNLLMVDTSYDLDTLKARGALSLITSRDLDGFFRHVWFAQPVVGASPAHRSTAVGPPRVVEIDPSHSVIEGHIAMRRAPTSFPKLSFVRAQRAFLRAVRSALDREGVCLVQASDPLYAGLVGLVVARRYQVPLSIRVSGNYDETFKATGRLAYPRLISSRRAEQAIVRRVLQRADLIFPANENNQSYAVSNGARLDRCFIIPAYGDVLDPQHLTEPQDRPRPDDVPGGDYLLMVSRLEPVKHPEDALEVVRVLRERGRDVSLVVAGQGSMQQELKSLAEGSGLTPHIRFMGDKPQDWIAGAAAHSIAVLSPLTGRALIEALLSGRPVVAYDVEWQGEVISHNENGLLAPYRDREAMASGVERLLADATFGDGLGRSGRATALELADPEKVRKMQHTAYRRILGSTTSERVPD